MKMLIVDDEEVARTSLAGLLSPLGEVVLAPSGEAALALLEGGLRPDICCSDVFMPGMDGLELLRRARAHPVWKDLPFVLISVAAERAMVAGAVAAGAAGYILKPFMGVQTRCTVERVVRDHRAARCEHFLVTSRRLGITLARLEELLAGFAADVDTVATDLSGGRGGAAELRRLHASTVVLGMWKASTLLQDAMADGTPLAARILALHETRELVEDQVDALNSIAPLAVPVTPEGA